MSKHYDTIFKHYESCFEEHGDSAKGVDWPIEKDVPKRYQVMMDVVKSEDQDAISFLDIGCGAGHFYEYLQRENKNRDWNYTGLDISEKFIAHCRSKYPEVTWLQLDLLQESLKSKFDYACMNGVFTEKLSLSFEEMLTFWKELLKTSFEHVNRGLAFNVMSSQVDWERDDLFHLPLDVMADFVTKNLTRHFVIRRDYGLYEYTVYLYKA